MRTCKLAQIARLTAPTLLSLMAMASACTTDESGPPERRPFRDEWRQEEEVAFPYIGDDGSVQIFDITVGGTLSNDNFANRGDIIVDFVEQSPPYSILVEMRRFTTNTNEDAAEEDFKALSLWAFNSMVFSPAKPDDMDPTANCLTAGWLNGCGVRVYYDGLNQLERAGADIRVTLPAAYRHGLTVITEDADSDGDYLNRGNVCVSNLNASVDVELENGQAWVSLAEGVLPAPQCSPENNQACEDWVDEDGNPAAWAQDCPCVAAGEFGQVKVESASSASSNIFIDVPGDLWTSINAQNRGEMQTESDPEQHCTSQITVPGVVFEEIGNDKPWEARGEVNHPSEAAIDGAGFNIQAFSDNCAPVAYTEEPDEFVGVDNGSEQESQKRGNIEICSGCVRTQSCDQLIP